MVIFLTNVFQPQYVQKTENFERWKNWKIFMKKMRFFFGEKRFHFSKLHLYQMKKAQNMPVIADRLV